MQKQTGINHSVSLGLILKTCHERYPLTPAPRRIPNGLTGRPGASRPPLGGLNLPPSGLPLTPELS